MERCLEKVVESVAARFVGMAMHYSMAIEMWCLRKICHLDYLSEDVRCNSKERSERGCGSSVEIGGGEHVFPLYTFLLVGVHIQRRPFTSLFNVLVKLDKAHFEIAKWARSLEKRQGKKSV